MKNYYLKRIDELRTEVGSDIRSRPVETALKVAAAPFIPGLARKLTKSREKVRVGLDKARRAPGVLAKRAERLAAAKAKREAEAQNAAKKAAGEVAARNAGKKAAGEVAAQNAAIKAAGEPKEKPGFGAGIGTDPSIGRISRPSTRNTPPGPAREKPENDFSKFGAGVNPDADPEGDKRRTADYLNRLRNRNLQGKRPGPGRLGPMTTATAQRTRVGDRGFRFRQQRQQQQYSRENASTTYIQIGYILAESMGLIDEGKVKDALKYMGFLGKEMAKDFAAIPGEMGGMAREDLAKIKARLKKKKK